MLHSGTSTFGGVMLGAVISSILWGVNTVQAVMYFYRFSTDSGAWLLHVLVVVAWILQGLELFFLSLESYVSGLRHPFSVHLVAYYPWIGTSWVIIGVVMSGMVQTFYAWRVYQLSHKIYLMPVLTVLIVLKLGVGIATAVLPIARGMTTWTIRETQWVPPLWMATDGVLDLTLLVCMCVALFAQRTGLRSTDRLINRMLRYCLHTGLLTSTVTIGSAISYWRCGTGTLTIALNISAFSLYVSAMLANLHTRSRLREIFQQDIDKGLSIQLQSVEGSDSFTLTATPVRTTQ
ncbi:hypothetical protein BS47DRAFT_1385149 [Hydnum rufescens UP504]|uniref:DUF6534 domain-containing protein n=1 Tax=Hydnum rufescens UP504 TaxID=1448309 RepID=A0A9P6AKC3_9AGAM|nr:hypothetical protein BS47DRAFT_1385149 [Hydnum rufescens UP504]